MLCPRCKRRKTRVFYDPCRVWSSDFGVLSDEHCPDCGQLAREEVFRACIEEREKRKKEEDEKTILKLTIAKLEAEVRSELIKTEIIKSNYSALESIVQITALAPYKGWELAMKYWRNKDTGK